jgi:uncharacterized protein YciI
LLRSRVTLAPKVVHHAWRNPMRWVAIFQDTAGMLAVRQEREALHFEYLRKHESEILIAGGLREAPGSAFVGGLWVLEVASKERAIALVEKTTHTLFPLAAAIAFSLGARQTPRERSCCEPPGV